MLPISRVQDDEHRSSTIDKTVTTQADYDLAMYAGRIHIVAPRLVIAKWFRTIDKPTGQRQHRPVRFRICLYVAVRINTGSASLSALDDTFAAMSDDDVAGTLLSAEQMKQRRSCGIELFDVDTWPLEVCLTIQKVWQSFYHFIILQQKTT